MSNITLYYAPGSASLVVHWLLFEFGVPHTLKLLNLAEAQHKLPAYLAINPVGTVPTLLVDAEAIWESAAIVMYLADAYPEAGLSPELDGVERGQYYEWICLCVNVFMPAFRSWFYPSESAGEESEVKLSRKRESKHFGGGLTSIWPQMGLFCWVQSDQRLILF